MMWPRLRNRLDAYERLMRLDKPIGILLLLWPTLWALWLGSGELPPNPWVLAIFVLGTVLMRSAGCVINDWADRGFDGHVARTRGRPLVRGEVSSREALALTLVLCALAFVLVLALNRLAILLAFPALFLALSYPFTKRFLALPQAYLGVAFGFGIPMGFAALSGAVPPLAWLLLAGNVFWALAYDTEYALVDREDDLKIGIRTAAITFGRLDRHAIAACYLAFLLIFAWVGHLAGCGALFYAGVVVASVQAAWHLWLIRAREPGPCFRAFMANNWLGASLFAGLAADHAWRFGQFYPQYFRFFF